MFMDATNRGDVKLHSQEGEDDLDCDRLDPFSQSRQGGSPDFNRHTSHLMTASYLDQDDLYDLTVSHTGPSARDTAGQANTAVDHSKMTGGTSSNRTFADSVINHQQYTSSSNNYNNNTTQREASKGRARIGNRRR